MAILAMMAIRRTALNFSPAMRLILRPINHSIALPNDCHQQSVRCSSAARFFSNSTKSNSSETLIRVIESEIKCAEESDDHDMVEEIPTGFPFKIEDNHGEQTISLRREYQDETIRVEVHMPDIVSGEDNNEGDDDEDGKSGQSSVPLVVSISKGKGCSLEFGCTAFPDEISIESLSVKSDEVSGDQLGYEGPDFNDLDENLQKAFHKYLEIRGIKPSTTNFLHEYMVNKDSREYLMWLKNLKKFVEA